MSRRLLHGRRHPVHEIGATIADKYKLVGVLGSGGTAVVYEAIHTLTLRRVALKVIDRSVIENGEIAHVRFLREARALASIRHPGVVDIVDAGQVSDGSPTSCSSSSKARISRKHSAKTAFR